MYENNGGGLKPELASVLEPWALSRTVSDEMDTPEVQGTADEAEPDAGDVANTPHLLVCGFFLWDLFGFFFCLPKTEWITFLT